MNKKKLQVLKKEKEAQDLVQKLNSTFYDIRDSYQGLVNLVKKKLIYQGIKNKK